MKRRALLVVPAATALLTKIPLPKPLTATPLRSIDDVRRMFGQGASSVALMAKGNMRSKYSGVWPNTVTLHVTKDSVRATYQNGQPCPISWTVL